MNQNKPVVFWHSDPIKPGETMLLSGGNFEKNTMVEISADGTDWLPVEIFQRSEISLKVLIPETTPPGEFLCRISNGKENETVFEVNVPQVWWTQGDHGVDSAVQGGFLRIFGVNLEQNGKAEVRLDEYELTVEFADCFEIRALLPADIPPARSRVLSVRGHNTEARITTAFAEPDNRPVLNVMEFGADDTGKKDSTIAFVQAMEFARKLPHGAIVDVPHGTFRLDLILRPMRFMDSQLFIMENTTLRGAGADRTNLWCADKQTALPCLFELANGSALENLSIYAQGKLHDIIKCDSNTRIENVRIRANSAFMLRPDQKNPGHHGRELPAPNEICGCAVELWGQNNRVLNCDINAGHAISIYNGRGSIIRGNRITARSFMYSICGSELVFEDNELDGGTLGGGGNIAVFGGNKSWKVLFRRNSVKNVYLGDREALTNDGHGVRFFGRVTASEADRFRPADNDLDFSRIGYYCKSPAECFAYIVDGRGTGQIRQLREFTEEGEFVLEKPWDILPDETSLLQVGAFNGYHLILDNRFTDVGVAVQLYPINANCIVAGNEAMRSHGFFALAQSHGLPPSARIHGQESSPRCCSFEISWYNQFLNNRIPVGANWGRLNRYSSGRTLETALCWLYSIASLETYNEKGEHIGYSEFDAERLKTAFNEKKLRSTCPARLRFAVIRNLQADDNAGIRLEGAVSDVIVEHCSIENTRCGIQVTNRLGLDESEPNGFDFQKPSGILLRGNHFQNVKNEYCGNALDTAMRYSD